MSKELRAVAIVFAALAGLVVLGFVGVAIAFTVFAKRVASEPRDPAAMARTVHKLATFDLPRGFVIDNATDLGFSMSATLRPANRRSAFRISLQGSTIPSNGDTQTSGAVAGLQIAERMLGCAPGGTTSVNVTVRGATHVMQRLRCTDKSGQVTQAEFVSFPGNVPSVSLTAVGAGADFDDAAVRTLLASVK
jgi:hypothetical protein